MTRANAKLTAEPERANGTDATKPPRIQRLERDAVGLLVAYVEGRDEPVADARLARCFPWSVPGAYISVRDAEGREVALLETLDVLDDASRGLAEQELRDKVFNPKIRRIVAYEEEFDLCSMTAETDRGQIIFQFHGRDDVRLLSATRALFRDLDGNTYEIEDITRLDPASRKRLQRYF